MGNKSNKQDSNDDSKKVEEVNEDLDTLNENSVCRNLTNRNSSDNHHLTALYQLTSSEYQFHPVLSMVFSFLPTSTILNRIYLVNSHFRNIVCNMTFPEIRIDDISFRDENCRYVNHIYEYLRFKEGILGKRYRTHSLSVRSSIFVGFFMCMMYEKHYGEKKAKKKITKERSMYPSVTLLNLFNTERRYFDLSPFSHLFSKLSKLEIRSFSVVSGRRISASKPFDTVNVIDFLNFIPHLRHFILHDFEMKEEKHITKSFVERELKPHKSLRIFQLRSEVSTLLRFREMTSDTKIEEFIVEVMEKCPSLSIFEVPFLQKHFVSQSLYSDDFSDERKSTDGIPDAKSSVLKTYLRKRFLNSSNEFILPNPDEIVTDFFPIFFDNPLRTFTLARKRIAEPQRSNIFIINGVPFLILLSVRSYGLYAKIYSPFVDFSCVSQLSSADEINRRLPLSSLGDISMYYTPDYGGRFGLVHHLFYHDFGDIVINKKKYEMNDFDSIPISIVLNHVFTTKEFRVLKKSSESRKEEKKKKVKETSTKEERVVDILFTQQKYYKKKDTVAFDINVDHNSVLLGKCSHYFTVFEEDILDFRLDYNLNYRGKTNRRSFFLYRMFHGEVFIPLCYHIKLFVQYQNDENSITMISEEEGEGEGEGESYDGELYEFTSSYQYYDDYDAGWGFEFLLRDDQFTEKNVSSSTFKPFETKLRFIVTVDVMDKVLSSEEWRENHRRYFDSINCVYQNSLKYDSSVTPSYQDTGLPMIEEREIVLIAPEYGMSSQIGIVKGHQPEEIDPRIRTIRFCGIDFSVEFANFGLVGERVGCCAIYFKIVRLCCSDLKIHGRFRVRVRDRDIDEIFSSEMVKKVVPGSCETCITDLCPVDRTRVEWKFLVSFTLERVNWEEKKK